MSEPRGADSVLMGDAVPLDISASAGVARSRRLLRLVGDDRLVAQVRRGSEPAFEVVFERHAPPVLSFCRHMLGSLEEAEDVVQHTFAAAYRDLQRAGDREIALKPWLFTIARNRCLSVLRARRELPLESAVVATAGLSEQVEQRAELRQLVADVRDLPDEQRAALLLAEVGGLPHSEIGSVLGCEVRRVKALVYRARSSLVARREARELPCEQIREQLANLRGGSLRRTELRLHLRECAGCRDFREQVRRQRKMLSAALPVVPTVGLKTSVLGAIGIAGGGGAAGGGAAVAGGATVAKVAAVAVLAAGSVAGGTAVVEHERDAAPAVKAPAPERAAPDGAAPERSVIRHEPSVAAPGHANTRHRHRPPSAHDKQVTPPGKAPDHARGRGPIETPPKDTPVRRGPPEAKVKPEKPAKTPHEPQGQARHGQPSKPGVSEKVKSEPQGKAKGPDKAR
jgi:RNA polymerase sigma factor (sigma-70 family)